MSIKTKYQPFDLNPQLMAGIDYTNVPTIYEYEYEKVLIKVESCYSPQQVPGEKLKTNLIACPQQVFDILRALYRKLDDDQEHLVILALKGPGNLTGLKVLGSGARDHCVIDNKVIFLNAIALGADSIILAHNHTCGSPVPSPADVRTTEKLIKAAAELDIPLLDHLIVTSGDYCSMHRHMPDLFDISTE